MYYKKIKQINQYAVLSTYRFFPQSQWLVSSAPVGLLELVTSPVVKRLQSRGSWRQSPDNRYD